MTDLTPSQRLGRRVNYILVDRSVFAWLHRIVGALAGCACVFSAIVTESVIARYWRTGTWRLGFSAECAVLFAIAAFPFVVSYLFNVDRVSGSIRRTVLFALILSLSSFAIDACTLAVFRNGVSPPLLVILYIGQSVAYVFIGRLALGDRLQEFRANA
jgi:hypothetical protein